MFEFEDDDFTLMESFSLTAADNRFANFEDQALARGTYLGDGVWVVDLEEHSEMVGEAQSPVSEK
jgi:hypothetical protein